MALNVSNELMLLVQKKKKKTSTHHHFNDESYRVGLCVKSRVVAFGKYKKRCLIASALKICKKELLQTIYNLASWIFRGTIQSLRRRFHGCQCFQ